MKRKVLSLVLVIAILASCSSLFASGAGASDWNYDEYITKPLETVIQLDGLDREYRFVQLADSHVVNLSSNPSSYYYTESVDRYKQFAGQTISNGARDTTSNGKPAKDTLAAMYSWCNEPENKIDCIWLTGDNIDYPSNENVSYITNLVSSGTVDHMYCFGNHDWTYPSKYFTSEGRSSFRPLLTSAMGGNNLVAFRDYGAFCVVMIDNSENYIYYSAVADFIRNSVAPLNKPTILLSHVPFYNSQTLAYSKSIWGTDETMANPHGSTKYTYNAATKYIYEWATTNKNVIALFNGHFHVTIDAPIAGGAMQYNTAAAYQGVMRVITVRPTRCAVHTWNGGTVITPATVRPGKSSFTCTVCGYTEERETPAIYRFGDVDCDGTVSAADARRLKQYMLRVSDFTTDRETMCADVNGDGRINTKDALMLRKYLAGAISVLG